MPSTMRNGSRCSLRLLKRAVDQLHNELLSLKKKGDKTGFSALSNYSEFVALRVYEVRHELTKSFITKTEVQEHCCNELRKTSEKPMLRFFKACNALVLAGCKDARVAFWNYYHSKVEKLSW